MLHHRTSTNQSMYIPRKTSISDPVFKKYFSDDTVGWDLWEGGDGEEGRSTQSLRISLCGTIFTLPINLRLRRGCFKKRNWVELQSPTRLEKFLDENTSHEDRLKLCDAWDLEDKAYFFMLPVAQFEMVLGLFATGRIDTPREGCWTGWISSWKYWDIRPLSTDEIEGGADRPSVVSSSSGDSDLVWAHLVLGPQRQSLHALLEDPTSSKAAHIYSSLSALFVLFSLFVLIAGSLRDLQVKNEETWEPHPVLLYAEYTCIAWFTKEFLLRFIVTPHKLAFIKEGQNIVDILSILPFYLELLLIIFGISTEDIKDIQGALLALRLLRIMRVARLLRLARHSGSMKSLGTTLKSSWKEVCMLCLFMSVAIVLYSTVMYFLEKDQPDSKFTSIPACFWWCVTTMTTVGYGDMVPRSVAGKMVASLTSVSGVVVLGFPIAIIVENFDKVYRAGQRAEQEKERESTRSIQRAAQATA